MIRFGKCSGFDLLISYFTNFQIFLINVLMSVAGLVLAN